MMHADRAILTIGLLGVSVPLAFGIPQRGEPVYTTDFALDECRIFLPAGGNAYFDLHPGRFLRFEGEEEEEFIELEIRVLPQIRPIVFELEDQWMLALARVIEEREWVDGELAEISRNYFARCSCSDDVYYFGEDVDIYEEGEIIGHDGSWLAGVDDARPGLIMPDLFLLGSRYFQEIAPDVALDRAEHMEMGLTVETPAGIFENCVMVIETTPLDPDEESLKIYAPDVGLIVDDVLELIEYHD